MAKSYAILMGLWLLVHSWIQAQSVACSNIGFEEGTTRGWVLTNGTVTDVNQQTVYQDETVGTFENGHLLTKVSDGNDPNVTAEAIPMVAPGGTHSLRIGNVTRGSRFDRIRGSFVVTADNTLFQYQFAVVLQNPAHQPYQQPGFTIRITNQAGTTLACSAYDVQAATNISGFKAQGDLRYRNWTTGAINLQAYVGQTVTIEVTAHGCTEKKHFGYAYFDAQCLKTEITAALYCPGVDKTMTLQAPAGFASYRWSTGETTQTIRIQPQQGAQYGVTLTPLSSLTSDCQLYLSYTVQVSQPPKPTQQIVSICEGDSYQVGDSIYRAAGIYVTPIKRGAQLCDSLVQTTLILRPLAHSTQSLTLCQGDSVQLGGIYYSKNGVYQTRLTRATSLCDSVVTTQVTVQPFSLSLSSPVLIRPGDSTQLEAFIPSGAGDIQLNWSPAIGLSCTTCAVSWVKPQVTTQYTVVATDLTLGCRRQGTILVTVSSCILYAPDVFSPNQDGFNDVFVIPKNACIGQINELTIYDRWGEVIFQRHHIPAADAAYGWDGRYRGAAVEAGVYTYQVDVSFINGLTSHYQGKLLLIR